LRRLELKRYATLKKGMDSYFLLDTFKHISSNMQSYPMQIMNTLNLAKNSPSIQKYALTTQFI